MEENTGFNFFPVFNALQNIIFSIEDKSFQGFVLFLIHQHIQCCGSIYLVSLHQSGIWVSPTNPCIIEIVTCSKYLQLMGVEGWGVRKEAGNSASVKTEISDYGHTIIGIFEATTSYLVKSIIYPLLFIVCLFF